MSVELGEGQVGPRDQVSSVSLTEEEGSEGNTEFGLWPVASELSMGHPDGNSCA